MITTYLANHCGFFDRLGRKVFVRHYTVRHPAHHTLLARCDDQEYLILLSDGRLYLLKLLEPFSLETHLPVEFLRDTLYSDDQLRHYLTTKEFIRCLL